MVTTVYLIRHGETEGAEIKRYKGTLDVPLSEKGTGQIERLSQYLFKLSNTNRVAEAFTNPGMALTAVYCSDLSRAQKSAEIIARPYSLIPKVVPALRERSFGLWEGMSFDEIREQYPDEFNAWAGNPLEFSPMNGETTLEVRDRVIDALEMILRSNAGEHVAVVAHGGVNRIVLCHVLGIPLQNIFRVDQDFAALNIIEFWDRYPVVKLLNGTIRE